MSEARIDRRWENIFSVNKKLLNKTEVFLAVVLSVFIGWDIQAYRIALLLLY